VSDDFRATWLGSYPYRCRACAYRFHLRQRVCGPPEAAARSTVLEARDGSVAVAFRQAAMRPMARIVVSADSDEQLNNVLLTLERAISSYETGRGETQECGAREARHNVAEV